MNFLIDLDITPEKETVINQVYQVLKLSGNKIDRHFLEIRTKEFEVIEKKVLDLHRFHTALEIGCGIGLHSIFLSEFCSRVYAMDRDVKDSMTHSMSMDPIRTLCTTLDLGNVFPIDGICEQIPLDNNSVDLIYSNYVFDHIVDKNIAMREVNRVLRSDGIMITSVPTFSNRIEWIFKYFLSKAFIINWLRPPYILVVKKGGLKDAFSHFSLIIPPHDHRFSFIEECIMYRERNWINMLWRNNHQILQSFKIRNDTITFVSKLIQT